ncbi:MAG: hypothetical protein HQL63_11530 [Magnetococcales bacterium]|nr:hypothetical protein [Magnetococcales bacterium]MBF0322105.1 hypothetical protein [Magnetococcales bacterium]
MEGEYIVGISTIANYLNGRTQKSASSQKRERHDDFFAKATARSAKEGPSRPVLEPSPAHDRLSEAYRVTISAAAQAKMNMAALA